MFAYAKPEQKKSTKSTVQNKTKEKKPTTPNLTGIPDKTKTNFENFSGFSFNNARVHYNSDKTAQFHSLAYTQGNQVYVVPGQEKHLQHELGHVVQQKQGAVLEEDKPIQMEADDVAQRMKNSSGKNVDFCDAGFRQKIVDLYIPHFDESKIDTYYGKIDKIIETLEKEGYKLETDDDIRLDHIIYSDFLMQPTKVDSTEMKLGADKNVTFGLNEKKPEDIANALSLGYRTFDGGDTYIGTAKYLSDAIKGLKIKRTDIQLIYKIDRDYKTKAELEAHINEVADLFDGYIDCLMVHHEANLENYNILFSESFLNYFMKNKIAHSIGLSNIVLKSLLPLSKYEYLQMDAMSLLDLLKTKSNRLNDFNGTIFVYNIVKAARTVGSNDTCSFIFSLQQMISYNLKINLKFESVMSSSNPEIMNKNLEMSREKIHEGSNFEAYKAIETHLKKDSKKEFDTSISEKVYILYKQVAGKEAFNTQESKEKTKAALQFFHPSELETLYTDGENTYSLEIILRGIFSDKSWSNCEKVNPFNLLTKIFNERILSTTF